jgi:hypothetical protein
MSFLVDVFVVSFIEVDIGVIQVG